MDIFTPTQNQTLMDYQNRIIKKLYFVTATVVDWIDIFTRPVYKHIVLESLQYCQQKKGLSIYDWVLMTNHLHLIVSVKGEVPLSDILRDFKKFTSKKIIETLQQDQQESRKRWMLSPFEYAGQNDRKIKRYRFWQEGVNCQEIFLPAYFIQKLNYIHANPVRAEIVNRAEDYRYSSAMDYSGDKGLLDIAEI